MLGLISCQPISNINNVLIDYDQLPKIKVLARNQQTLSLYMQNFNDPYIDHSLLHPPKFFLDQWLAKNLDFIGNENEFMIKIIDGSLKKSEIINTSKKKYQDKKIFLYETSFLVEFILYDDSGIILGSSLVESSRSTTSSMYISLNQTENIIEQLIYKNLIDFSRKANELLTLHINNYIL